MTHDRTVAAVSSVFAGWRIMRSDAGRFWATRERPFPRAVEDAGAHRTVDADDLVRLCQAIAEQEGIAEQARPSAWKAR
ncbi:hypothetical protein [Nonomuraea wenchangensis]|uniref:Uncharacterized protein n=1 Tax=Nonomuraea wenchangensis TaxID=568860 RepID=A0A1I0CX56_9ACTN|nr:hypothetical protein [Nonomuraea wenchangensis]SET23715.1 hypothetical protein SAMN05421811_102469 [Nonomuraea wenchangensis]